jgi:hypothetical protein
MVVIYIFWVITSIYLQDTLYPAEPRDVHNICTPCPAKESICSFKSSSPIGHGNNAWEIGASSGGKTSASKPAASGSKACTPASYSQPQGQNAVGLQSTDANHVSILANSVFT